MAAKTKEQLESELAEALAKIATLESDNLKFVADIEARDSKIAELQKALGASGKEKPPAVADSEDEKEIRRRMSGGISRKHAQEAHAAQKEHDARLKQAAAAATDDD